MKRNNIVKKLMAEKSTLNDLDVSIREIHSLKSKGYNIRSENIDGQNYYWIKTMDLDNHLIISPRSSELEEIIYAEVSDIHCGCEAHDSEGFEWFLKYCEDHGVKHIHNSGDTTDGTGVYPGQVNYLKYVTEEAQINVFLDVASKFKFDWYAIDGNHDFSWLKKGAPSPNKLISQQLPNYHYIPGKTQQVVRADLVISGVMKRMVHPWSNTGRSTYAKSYPGQIYLRNCMENGVQFEIGNRIYHLQLLQYGHLHYDMAYTSFGVRVTHPLSFQKPNDFTEGMGKVGPRGGRITKLMVQDGQILDYESKAIYVPDRV